MVIQNFGKFYLKYRGAEKFYTVIHVISLKADSMFRGIFTEPRKAQGLMKGHKIFQGFVKLLNKVLT